ncbi:MAG: MEDS domain-containing protein, partial [Chloroflexota bacterium]
MAVDGAVTDGGTRAPEAVSPGAPADAAAGARRVVPADASRGLADLQAGDHLCCLHETEDERRAAVALFIREGLERGERLLCLVDPVVMEAILGHLRDDGLDVGTHVARGRIVVPTADEGQLRGGVTDPTVVVAMLRAETERALADGCGALCVAGDVAQLLGGLPDAERLLAYEAALDELISGGGCLVLCLYDRRRFEPAVLPDALRAHPSVVVGDRAIGNPRHVRPADLRSADRVASDLRAWIRDLADRSRVEEELRASEARYRELFDVASDALFLIDPKTGRILDANLAASEMYGYERAELLAMRNADLSAEPEETRRLTPGPPTDEDARVHIPVRLHRREDGTVFPVEITGRFYARNGHRILTVAIREIMERVRAEEKLQRANDRLSLAARAGGVGMWDYDPVADTLAWDDQMFRLYGISREQFSGAYDAWQAGVHPDDRERGDAEIAAALRGEREFDTEFRVLWPDGTVRDIRALALVSRDASGRPVRMIGTNWDITAQKHLERALASSEENFRTFFETVDDIILV